MGMPRVRICDLELTPALSVYPLSRQGGAFLRQTELPLSEVAPGSLPLHKGWPAERIRRRRGERGPGGAGH